MHEQVVALTTLKPYFHDVFHHDVTLLPFPKIIHQMICLVAVSVAEQLKNVTIYPIQ